MQNRNLHLLDLVMDMSWPRGWDFKEKKSLFNTLAGMLPEQILLLVMLLEGQVADTGKAFKEKQEVSSLKSQWVLQNDLWASWGHSFSTLIEIMAFNDHKKKAWSFSSVKLGSDDSDTKPNTGRVFK